MRKSQCAAFGGRKGGAASSGGGGGSSSCGACKFLQHKCERNECVFAPYFSSEEGAGAAQFAAIHRVFGASNISKLLRNVQAPRDRGQAVMTITYEAQAMVGDPVYGCVGLIFALQQKVASLQLQLIQAKAQLIARSWGRLGSAWRAEQELIANALYQRLPCAVAESMAMPKSASSPPQNVLNINSDSVTRQEMQYSMLQDAGKALGNAGELQALAFRMMGN